MFLFFFSISPTPSSTLVMSYILLFCLTARLSAACQIRHFTKGLSRWQINTFDKILYRHLNGPTRKQTGTDSAKPANNGFCHIKPITLQIKALRRKGQLYNSREGRRRRREMVWGACCVNITQLWRARREGKNHKKKRDVWKQNGRASIRQQVGGGPGWRVTQTNN